jgi:hypothetical protein
MGYPALRQQARCKPLNPVHRNLLRPPVAADSLLQVSAARPDGNKGDTHTMTYAAFRTKLHTCTPGQTAKVWKRHKVHNSRVCRSVTWVTVCCTGWSNLVDHPTHTSTCLCRYCLHSTHPTSVLLPWPASVLQWQPLLLLHKPGALQEIRPYTKTDTHHSLCVTTSWGPAPVSCQHLQLTGAGVVLLSCLATTSHSCFAPTHPPPLLAAPYPLGPLTSPACSPRQLYSQRNRQHAGEPWGTGCTAE